MNVVLIVLIVAGALLLLRAELRYRALHRSLRNHANEVVWPTLDGHRLSIGDTFEWPAPGPHSGEEHGVWTVTSVTLDEFSLDQEDT